MTKAHNRFPNTNNILVTGSGSFTGGKLLQALDRDPSITGTIIAADLERPRFPLNRTRFYKLNLMGKSAGSDLYTILKKEAIKTVIHAAFPISPPKKLDFAHELISIGTMYVVNACTAANIKRLVVLSTADVYGAFPDNPNFLTENHPPRGNRLSQFLRDKIDAENQALHAHRTLPHMTVVILRICTILGPTVETYKTRYLRREVVPTILGYDPLVQFVQEEDVIAACRLAMESDQSGIYNIAAPGVLSLSDVITICGKTNLPLPKAVLKTIAQTLWYLDLSPAPSTHLNFIQYLWLVDGEKATRELGFKPQFSSKEALLSFVGGEKLRASPILRSAAYQPATHKA